MKSDLEIAQSVTPKPIVEIAESLGLKASDLELYGQHVAKIKLDVLKKGARRKQAKYIDVTAITPTPLGEGKTVTTIGLALGLNAIGKKAICTLRQPSLGPVFGIKGGAAGGGRSQVIPMEEFNLHLTGDFHAVSAANNLLAAFIDNHVQKGNELGIDPFTISWKRVVDVNDRSLRSVVTGLGNKLADGIPRETGFDITAASEVMAILALASDLHDLRARLGRIVVGMNKDGKPVTAEDLRCAGAMTVLLKDAIKPNLMQTLEGTACIVHAGPFANIAHGNNSILADLVALQLADYVVTESGFGADMGFEKFCDIKCRTSGLRPDAVVLVVTVRALKAHSGLFQVVAGKPLDKGLVEENIPALRKGSANMLKHIENIRTFGLPVVVAINTFATDTAAEIDFIKATALEAGAEAVEVSEVHAKGGEGGAALAEAVVKAASKPNTFDFLYPIEMPIKEKIDIIAHKLYGAGEVFYEPAAEKQIKVLNQNGLDKLPICMAKTHLSLSHEPALKGRPTGFRMPVREVRASIGAGFLSVLCGAIPTMPGLPSIPGGTKVDIDKDGKVVGLF
ncbi:MAG: formate--tetrahydrofolate ligase [Verrucomicrobia bacterium]|nr:formate--tetrahydrofolate ligase [Verrucomicrobiota bacterium]